MPNVRVHKPNGALFFDFRHKGERCREYTLLTDTPANRKKLEKVLAKIESEIVAGTFVYANYFPNSKALKRLSPTLCEHARLELPALGEQGVAIGAARLAALSTP